MAVVGRVTGGPSKKSSTPRSVSVLLSRHCVHGGGRYVELSGIFGRNNAPAMQYPSHSPIASSHFHEPKMLGGRLDVDALADELSELARAEAQDWNLFSRWMSARRHLAYHTPVDVLVVP